MRHISIADTTLAEAAALGAGAVGFKEKIEVVKILDRTKVDIIELPFTAEDKVNSLLIKTLAPVIKESRLSVPGGDTVEQQDNVWAALSGAKRPILRVCLPVSPIKMEYDLHKKPAKVIELIKELVSHGRALCKDVDFVADDVAGAEKAFLKKAVAAAVSSGATMVTLWDSKGDLLPDEVDELVEDMRELLADGDAALGIQTANPYRMAEAACFEALDEGAAIMKASSRGRSAARLETVAEIIKSRGDSLGYFTDLAYSRVRQSTKLINQMIYGTKAEEDKADGPMEASADKDGADIVLKEGDSLATVGKAAKALGYELSPEERKRVFEAFTELSRKKQIEAKELEAIIANEAMQVPATYRLKSYVINNGNLIRSTAHIVLEKQNGSTVSLEGFAVGDGPVEAAFHAIEQILGHHYELDDFQIQSITQGREALGDALVKLRAGGKLYSGKGMSEDIIGASIGAYISAVNKIVYEEKTI